MNSDEQEHLFAPGVLFRVDHVQHMKKAWYIHITLVDQDYSPVRQIIDHWENILGEHSLSSTAYEQPVLYYTPFGFRALLYMIENCDRTELARNEMIEVMREYNATKCTDMKIIDESAMSYQADRAIDWCMKDKSLCNLLMETLEKHDINKIFKLRYLIRDYLTQLNRLKQDQSEWYEGYEDEVVSFYFAKVVKQTTMEKFYDEFHQHPECQHSSSRRMFRQFLAASTNLHEAGKWVGIDFENKYTSHNPWISPNSDRAFVLFILKIPMKAPSPLSWLHYPTSAAFPGNILLSPGSQFRIDSIARKGEANNLWYLNMTLDQDGNDQIWKTFNSLISRN